jgi:tetratricopeptide (TPR) repeat protein
MTLFEEALALHKRGLLDEAATLYERAIAGEPSKFPSVYHLSLLRAQQGRTDDALRLAAEAVALDVDSPEALAHLGAVLLSSGRHADAVSVLERAVALKPGYAQAYGNLGSAMFALGRVEEAIARYRRALELEPAYADAHNNLANALHAVGRFDEAMEHFEIASSYQPGNAKVIRDMGVAMAEMGRLDEAQAAYERAIEIEPRAEFFRQLGEVRKYSHGDRHLPAMERLAKDIHALDVESQTHLHFALGKAYADTGEHERSFRHLLAGNALRRSTEDYDEAATLASFETIPKVFTRDVMEAHRDRGDPSNVPVFILGMPRSGTTLIEQILAAHPEVYAAGERSLFEDAVADVFPGSGEALSAERLKALGARYLAGLRALAPGAQRITDKMPANFRFAGLINLALPNARIIYARRDPIDNCLSCFALLFHDGQEHTYDLAELGRYYRGHESLMDHWRAVLPPGIMLDVQYEAVVADLETQARGIVAHAGLPWNDACLAFDRVRRPVQTASAAQVRKPIYGTSVGRWKPYGHLLRPLFEALRIDPKLDA